MPRNISLSILAVVLFISCYEKQEGCLDFKARNYDFGADLPCEDCCTFPSMKVSVAHYWGEDPLAFDSFYLLDDGSSIRILETDILLSELYLTNSSKRSTVDDELEIVDLQGNMTSIKDNFVHVQSNRFTYTLGAFSEAETYESLDFVFGIDELFTSDEFPEDETLQDTTNFNFTNFRMVYVAESDTLAYTMIGPEKVENFSLEANIDLPLGVDFTLPLIFNYQRLLLGVGANDLKGNQVDGQLLDNISSSFSF